jgi:hypothetical protein
VSSYSLFSFSLSLSLSHTHTHTHTKLTELILQNFFPPIYMQTLPFTASCTYIYCMYPKYTIYFLHFTTSDRILTTYHNKKWKQTVGDRLQRGGQQLRCRKLPSLLLCNNHFTFLLLNVHCPRQRSR